MCRSGVGVCSCSRGLTAARYGFVAEKKPRAALGGAAGCRCRRCFWALAWCGRQGARFVAVGRRHCIRMPFESPCLVCNLSILHTKDARHMGMCAKSLTNGMNVAAPRAKRHGNRYSKADKMKASRTNDVSRRSSQKRCRSFCSSAFGRAASGAAAPRPYLKAME